MRDQYRTIRSDDRDTRNLFKTLVYYYKFVIFGEAAYPVFKCWRKSLLKARKYLTYNEEKCYDERQQRGISTLFATENGDSDATKMLREEWGAKE